MLDLLEDARIPLLSHSDKGCTEGSLGRSERNRPSVTPSATIAEPLSVNRARGRPRFWIAWESPWTRSSAVSERYHCTWQHSRE